MRSTVGVSISVPIELLSQFDEALKSCGITRSRWFADNMERFVTESSGPERFAVVAIANGKTARWGDKPAVFRNRRFADDAAEKLNSFAGAWCHVVDLPAEQAAE